MTTITVAIPLAVSAGLSAVLIPLILRLSHTRGWYDHYDDRKVHDGDIPRLAGVGIFVAAVAGFFVGLLFASGGSLETGANPAMIGVLAGLTLVHLTGVVDDFRNVRAWQKVLFQVAAAVLVMLGGTMIRSVGLPWMSAELPLGWIGVPITILWLMGVSNAVNLMDGIDGLAGGLSLVAAVGFGAAHAAAGNWVGVIAAVALAGALLGFLFFNFPPARIFMGDGGSLFLGFALAALPFLGPAGRVHSGMFIVAITILFVPILDVFAAILRRIRHRRPIHHPDREHVHHKLMDLGLKSWQIDVIVYLAGAGLAVAAVSAYTLEDWRGWVTILGVWIVGVAAFAALHYVRRAQKRRQADPQTQS